MRCSAVVSGPMEVSTFAFLSAREQHLLERDRSRDRWRDRLLGRVIDVTRHAFARLCRLPVWTVATDAIFFRRDENVGGEPARLRARVTIATTTHARML